MKLVKDNIIAIENIAHKNEFNVLRKIFIPAKYGTKMLTIIIIIPKEINEKTLCFTSSKDRPICAEIFILKNKNI